ncbi:hypothetical protein [Desulfosporosinus sp. BG]|uniref:hypothetical protein n=1 Tax=Desulfosporosinus sp. BG TaxID=1633135 RepID=UPI00083A038A|nr:hypothetical protein [Desulfosporosinus sp. BG]ODA38974.1 Uracil phosphoribosyltransferase [Desulfosporosinus sp. BG]
MPSLALDKEISSVEKMKIKRETGEKEYPIWLLFNPKHPAIRHYIWTPVLAEIQDKVFRELHTRINTANMYIRNVVSDSGIVPNTLNWWGTEVSNEIELLRELVIEHQPKLLISFGAFPFEFVRRVYEIKPEKGPKAWGTSNLGDEFGKAIETFDINRTNRIPLLRRVVDSGKFIEEVSNFSRDDGDRYFEEVDNYFHFVGSKIAEKIIEHKDSLDIWI